jgi:4-hydroxybenzoate polyprenyltransferase
MQMGYLYFLALAIGIGIWFWQYLQISQSQPEVTIYQRIFKQNVAIGFLLLLGMLSSEFKNLSIW